MDLSQNCWYPKWLWLMLFPYFDDSRCGKWWNVETIPCEAPSSHPGKHSGSRSLRQMWTAQLKRIYWPLPFPEYGNWGKQKELLHLKDLKDLKSQFFFFFWVRFTWNFRKMTGNSTGSQGFPQGFGRRSSPSSPRTYRAGRVAWSSGAPPVHLGARMGRMGRAAPGQRSPERRRISRRGLRFFEMLMRYDEIIIDYLIIDGLWIYVSMNLFWCCMFLMLDVVVVRDRFMKHSGDTRFGGWFRMLHRLQWRTRQFNG